MNAVRVILADNNYLIREGLKTVLKERGIEVVGEVESSSELHKMVSASNPQVVLLDYSSVAFDITDIEKIVALHPDVAVVAITEEADRFQIASAMQSGVNGHLMKDCDRDEIMEAVQETAAGNKFYCGKILDRVNEDSNGDPSCEAVSLSPREIEIIQQVSSGFTNKEIADQLCLSQHTVMTHRKKIMAKLGINNTAGLVIYAVKQNLISPNKFLFDS